MRHRLSQFIRRISGKNFDFEYKNCKKPLLITGIGIAFSYSLYQGYDYLWNPFKNIPKIDETVFNNSDNFFVIFTSAKNASKEFKELLKELRNILDCSELRHVKLRYAIKNESQENDNLSAILYKGLRKKLLKLNDLNSLKKDEIIEFFNPVSQEEIEQNTQIEPEFVTLNTFKEKVLKTSNKEPVLLQLFEDGCFLCFLMRPFINSIHRILLEGNHKISIKRLNIERNDFPEGCPISRATPTFVLYKNSKPERWEEFKPQNLVEKLKKTVKLSLKEERELDKLVETLPKRLSLIANVTQWQSELLSLDHLGLPTDSEFLNEDDMHTFLLKIVMEQDMKRSDGLYDNIIHLKDEVNSLEKECILAGINVALELIDKSNDVNVKTSNSKSKQAFNS